MIRPKLNSGGDFTPYLKFNSKAGRWYVKENKEDVELVNLTFIADLYNLATGWWKFTEGSAPSVVMDPNIGKCAPKPEDPSYKRGFTIKVIIDRREGVYELSSTSTIMQDAIDELLNNFERGYRQHYGQLPIVGVKGSMPKKGQHGVNYRPVMEIIGWVERSDELPDDSVWTDGSKDYGRDGIPPSKVFDDSIPF